MVLEALTFPLENWSRMKFLSIKVNGIGMRGANMKKVNLQHIGGGDTKRSPKR